MSNDNNLNVREKLESIAEWYGYQSESLSDGLKSIEDGIKLYNYFQAHEELPEFCDEPDDDGNDLAEHRIAALGYDPLDTYPGEQL
jgi:hypothetical protein